MQRDYSAILWQRPTAMVRYPHLLAHDALVWTAFLRESDFPIQQVAYDVHVGTPIPLPPSATDQERAIADGTGSKRIDVVARLSSELWIIELKPYGNHTALGQVLQYRHLFQEDYRPPLPLQGVIICHEADVDVPRLAKTHGIAVIETYVKELIGLPRSDSAHA